MTGPEHFQVAEAAEPAAIDWRRRASDAIWHAAQQSAECNGRQPCQFCARNVAEAMTFADRYAEAAARNALTLLGDLTEDVIRRDDGARLVGIASLADTARTAREKAGLPPVEIQ